MLEWTEDYFWLFDISESLWKKRKKRSPLKEDNKIISWCPLGGFEFVVMENVLAVCEL